LLSAFFGHTTEQGAQIQIHPTPQSPLFLKKTPKEEAHHTEFSITPRSEWHTPECVSFTSSSPGPGAGVSSVETAVLMLPGWS